MLSERLKSLRKDNRYTQQDVADMLGIKRTRYTMYENGKNLPDIITIKKIAELYRVSTDFILEVENATQPNGSESRLFNLFNSADQKSREIALFALKIGQTEAFPTQTYNIDDFRDYPASAGTGNYIEDTQKETLELKTEPPSGACYVCRVSGDSMHGLYEDGDRVFVSVEPASEGEVGIFIYNNEIFIKRAGKGCLLSENPNYKPIIIHDSDSLFCIGTVLGKVDEDDIITD